MITSTQKAIDLGLPISNLIGAKRYTYYTGGRGYDRAMSIKQAEEKLIKEADDSYILINMEISSVRTSHPRSDFGDYTITISGDLFKIMESK